MLQRHQCNGEEAEQVKTGEALASLGARGRGEPEELYGKAPSEAIRRRKDAADFDGLRGRLMPGLGRHRFCPSAISL